jgi:hypothetical protein
MSLLVFIRSPEKRRTGGVFKIVHERHPVLMAIPDAPQLNRHHSGSFETLNIFKCIAVVEQAQLVFEQICTVELPKSNACL